MESEIKNIIEEAWSDTRPLFPRSRWWHSPVIIRYINKLVCGKTIDGLHAGSRLLLKELSQGKFFENALSIGCGNGSKEMEFLQNKSVGHFHLYDFAKTQILEGIKLADTAGVLNQITFSSDDFFAKNQREGQFDLVHWNNSLHHMLDTSKAVEISHKVLKKNGFFYCDDFIGANHFQWSNKELQVVNKLRASFPDSYFEAAHGEIERVITRPDLETFIQKDASEAANSQAILPAIKKYFPNATIIHTGGLIYHLALSDILVNIPENSTELQHFLKLDYQSIQQKFQHYAVIIACKK